MCRKKEAKTRVDPSLATHNKNAQEMVALLIKAKAQLNLTDKKQLMKHDCL